MSSKTRYFGIALLLMILTLALSSPLAAGFRAGPPAQIDQAARLGYRGEVTTATDAALRKLSPDLREAVAASTGPSALRAAGEATHLVFALVRPGTDVAAHMEKFVTSRRLGEMQWVAGEVTTSSLLKLASVAGVQSVTSTAAYQPLPAPGLDRLTGAQPPLTRERIQALLAEGGTRAVLEASAATHPAPQQAVPPAAAPLAPSPRAAATNKVADIHRATEAHAAGYTGQGVVAAVIDSGVDFGNPELHGTQARISGGPYDGWPFAYDTLSGLYYALDGLSIGPDNFWESIFATYYAHTLSVENATCDGDLCAAELMLVPGGDNFDPVVLDFTWPDTSQSGTYYYTVNPNFSHLDIGYLRTMGYASSHQAPAAVIVADEAVSGVYDTVYVDADFDQALGDEKPMRKGDELSGADIYDASWNEAADGYWDFSVSMLAWIADGENPPPGVSALYTGLPTPESGRLIVFIGDEDTHGTNVASMIAAQSVITDPMLQRNVNPLFAGGADAGGVGGPVMTGMAPDTRIAAFMRGFNLPFDAWTLAALGFDGVPGSGDEAQLVNNSWGDSFTTEDGWDATSRFAQYLNINFAPNTTFLVSTGNGGPGYGTSTSPSGGTLLKVGASTSNGSSTYFELVGPDQFTHGAIQPWSNRGPSALGDVDPDLVCVGAWGMGATALNRWPNGQSAYDLFGGTSMSSPICAGVAAITYQAFEETHGRAPTWREMTDLLTGGARDLGYNVLAQGAGDADAMRSVEIATGQAAYITPTQWQAGDYRGDILTPGFPAVVHAGDSTTVELTLHNPIGAADPVELRDVTLQRVHEISFTTTLGLGADWLPLPNSLVDISDLIDEYDPDLINAHVMFPFSEFDLINDYFEDNTVQALYYDWTDLNGDGDLWEDLNGDGLVDPEEIDVSGELGGSEINRFNNAYATTNYQMADIGRDVLSRRHDGVFFGLKRSFGTDDLDVTVTLILYEKADWSWLTLSSTEVDVPAGDTATVTATLNVPNDARPGVYEGAIEVDGQIIPVIANVAADSTTFEFGAASLTESLGDTPYDNGHLFGSTDWGWRPETGDWRLFFYDVPEGATGPGTRMIVETEWVHPEPVERPPYPPSLFFENFDAGIPSAWLINDNAGTCLWATTDDLGRNNRTGGSGAAAAADSDICFANMDTELVLPPIDLTAESEAWLAFHTELIGFVDVDGIYADHGYVDISTDEGANWTNMLDLNADTAEAQILDLSDYAGNVVLLRFRYVTPNWSYWWQIDDVGLFATDPGESYGRFQPDLTDVDTAVFAASEDEFATGDPAFFGPTGVTQAAASEDQWLYGGAFGFQTATGGPREIVGGNPSDGLGFVSLHNVLNAGRVVGEPVAGRAYQLTVAPAPLAAEATTVLSADPPTVGAKTTVTVESSVDLPEGLRVLGLGVSRPIVKKDETIRPGNLNVSCPPELFYTVDIENGALLEIISTSEMPALDIDLYLLIDDGDGVADCLSDPLVASSAGQTADEFISLTLPDDGRYYILVDGYSVPGGAGAFDITINAIQGRDLQLDSDTGPLTAGQPVTLDLSASVPYEPGSTWEGLLFIGPAGNPTASRVPVTITVPPLEAGELVSRFSAAPDGLETGDRTTFTLWSYNGSTDPEMAELIVAVPPGLVVDIASLSATQGQALYSIAERTVTWSGELGGGEAVTLTFDATAASRVGEVEARATARGLLRGVETEHTVPLWLNVPRPPRLINLPIVAR
jgi:subtilisin family serine protease